GPECKGTACKDQSDPNGSTKGSRDTPPGPLSRWDLKLYLEPRDVFGNPSWINPSSDPSSRYPVQVTIDDGVSPTTVTTWCNYGGPVGWCDWIGPFSGLPLTVTIDPPGLLTDSWRVISGPGTYSASDLAACGNPCYFPIVLQLKDLEIHLRKFWYGPELPSTGATYTLETGMGIFTLTCPADAPEEECLPYPLILEDWIDLDPDDRWITLNEVTLPADWVAVEEYGLGSWDGSEPPGAGYCYNFGPGDRWILCGNALEIRTVNLNTRDPQPPAGEFFVLEFRKAWIGPSLPTSGATIQVTFWPEDHWLHQTRTFTCPGSAPSEVCFQMNFPRPLEDSDFADFVMSITEVGGPPGWTPGGAFGSYDFLGLLELLGCDGFDCGDLPPACGWPSKEPEGPPICTIDLTNTLNASGGGGGSSSGRGGGASSDGTQGHDPAAQNLEYADQTTGQERLTDTRASNQSVPQVLPRTGRQWSPAWWIALLAAALPVAAGLALRPSRLRQRR
ncbi:MAG: hypothetical protein J7453_08245, partial [Thermomicrobium sp.]|nr:hypothetical protein [Thermomicrobium sp.]